MLRRALAAALCCGLGSGLALTGCGGGQERGANPVPTPVPTPTPTPIQTRPPTNPEVDPPALPTFAKGEIGQEAFATHVVQAWAYALASNDATPLVDLSVSRKHPCRGCLELVEELKERAEEGWSVFPFEVTVERVRLIESALGVTARIVLDVPETKSFFDDGSLRNTSARHDDSTFTISMRQDRRAYRLIGFTISQQESTG